MLVTTQLIIVCWRRARPVWQETQHYRTIITYKWTCLHTGLYKAISILMVLYYRNQATTIVKHLAEAVTLWCSLKKKEFSGRKIKQSMARTNTDSLVWFVLKHQTIFAITSFLFFPKEREEGVMDFFLSSRSVGQYSQTESWVCM